MGDRNNLGRDRLPEAIVTLLKNGRFCHLGTSYNDVPHVSLMTYVYIPAGEGSPYEEGPLVIMASHKDTQKFANLSKNKQISLLIHDWVTASNIRTNPGFSSATEGLSQLLQNMNQNEISSLSATFEGIATVLNGDEAEFFRDKLLQNNSDDARCFIESAEVIAVRLQGAKVTDKQNRSNSYEFDA